MKVKIINRTDYQQFVDISGIKKDKLKKEDYDYIYSVPAKSFITVEMTENEFIRTAKMYRNLIFKKIN